MRLLRKGRLRVYVRKRWEWGRRERWSLARLPAPQPSGVSDEQLEALYLAGIVQRPLPPIPARLLLTEYHLGPVEVRWQART